MKACMLKDDIWWVGVIDWSLRDFHGYETSRGSTYNSYLVLDDKVALVDTCKRGFEAELGANIREVLGDRALDYLVINHIEMDHSGAVKSIVDTFKPTEILCSRRAAEALPFYFGEEVTSTWNIKIVHTGEKVLLGKKSLEFIEAPMLHWPDSMFTYIPESKVLLPNDAFGQHLASSERFADEVDTAVVREEAAKYFANILMPLQSLLEKMLNRLREMNLEIEIIAPSHGVIWRNEGVGQILSLYESWIHGLGEKRVVLVYDTMWGSTEEMTTAVAEGLVAEGVACEICRLRRTPVADIMRLILESSGFLVGAPTINNGVFPSVAAFVSHLKGLKPRKKIAGVYGSYGWSGGAAKKIDDELRTLDHVKVMDYLEVRYRPLGVRRAACVEWGKEVARLVKALHERAERGEDNGD